MECEIEVSTNTMDMSALGGSGIQVQITGKELDTLQEIAEWGDSEYVVGCIALFCGKIRLIDNIVYKK